MLAVDLAHVFLGIELQSELLDQIELGFEKVDIAFLVLYQLLEEIF